MKKKWEPTAVPRSSLEFLFVATKILLALAAGAETRRTGTRDDALPFSAIISSVLHFHGSTVPRQVPPPSPLLYLFFAAWLSLKTKQSPDYGNRFNTVCWFV